jgi:hypothetical protein
MNQASELEDDLDRALDLIIAKYYQAGLHREAHILNSTLKAFHLAARGDSALIDFMSSQTQCLDAFITHCKM